MKHTLLAVACSLVMLVPAAFAQPSSEVHLVGLYQGGEPKSKAYRAAVKRHTDRCEKARGRCNWGGGWDRIRRRYPFKTKVTVTRTGAPIVLVLSAYDRTVWSVETAPGVQIERIILSGYEQQTLAPTSAIAGVPTDITYYGAPSVEPGTYFYFYRDDREVPVGPSTWNGRRSTCEEPAPEDLPFPRESSYQTSLNALAGMGLTPITVQGAYERASLVISDQTTVSDLEQTRSRGYCYRNADGSLSEGTGD